jgi:RHS repeat-associated protein
MKQQTSRRKAVRGRFLSRRRVRSSRDRDSIRRDRLCGVTYRIVTDNQGSVRLVVDAETGEVAQRLDYDSFGRVLRDTNPGFQPFGFQGGLYDPDTGLVEFGYRWYDAETGRWISKDPILLEGGWNVYAFCGSDPVNRADPSGLMALVRKFGWSRAIITDVTGKQEILTHHDVTGFRDAILRYPDKAISNITIYDHGDTTQMNIDGFGTGMSLSEVNGCVIFEDMSDSVAAVVGPKLSSGATICLSGCNTASEYPWNNDNNISKALSKELPGVRVSGNVGPAIGNTLGFFVLLCPLGPTKNWGIKRTYVNGVEK